MNQDPSARQAPAQPTLLFIPDISGFTRFVNQTEIIHSQHIVEELLEVLIDANELGLTVSEIEGDAILFFRNGPPPTLGQLLGQVQAMYVRFHAHLRRYATHRICQCGACTTASGLALKFVAHYGDVGRNQVKDHSKLFGQHVIIAHRLLKNAVPYDEYVLMTHDLLDALDEAELAQASWAESEQGCDEYDTGPAHYRHIPLAPLRDLVPEPSVEDYGLHSGNREVARHEAVIEAPMDLVFDVISDLSVRHEWQEGLNGSDRLNHKIPQHGATHRCVIQDSEKDPFFVSHDFNADEDLITFTDTERRQGLSVVYFIRRVDADLTRVEQHLLIRDSFIQRTLFRLFLKRRLGKAIAQSYQNLNEYCKRLVREGRRHPTQIVLHPSPVRQT